MPAGTIPGPPPAPAGTPGTPRRSGAVATLAVLTAVAVAVLGIVVASRSDAGTGPAAGFLPAQPTSTGHADRRGGVWQVSQGRLAAGDAWTGLSLPARRLLGAETDRSWAKGDWFTLDGLDRTNLQSSLDFQVDRDAVLLRAITTPDTSLVFSPGVPVLTEGLIAGGSTDWHGRLGRDAADPAEATVRVSGGAGVPRAGCVQVIVGIEEASETLGFCPGEGVVAWASDPAGIGFSDDRLSQPTASAVDEVPAAQPVGGEPRQVRFFRETAGQYREQLAPEGSRAVWAADQLVVADTAGRLTAWRPQPHVAGEAAALYVLRWRAQPGGSVRGVAADEAITVVGTTERALIGYDAVGRVQWRHNLPDAVTQVAAHDGVVVAVDAAGGLHAHHAASGQQAWQADGVAALLGLSGGNQGTVVVDRDGEVAALDLGTGRELWTTDADDGVQAVPFGSSVAVLQGNWLVVRERSTASVQWVRAVASDSLISTIGTSLLLSEPHAAQILDAAGAAQWRSDGDLPSVLAAPGGGLIGIAADARLIVAGAGATTVSWTFPAGARRPDIAPVLGDRGVLAYQLVGGRFTWWEYR